ncbi:transcription elongation regulator 1-like [Uloborus diversus]|uniref:transcription elongation regulator 1-like n=1 Tax=Uloborus diversus TaxID=327109 RepID=UPI00240A6549|nr:transcription elongation regulator 1-like [Uloborus diversus]
MNLNVSNAPNIVTPVLPPVFTAQNGTATDCAFDVHLPGLRAESNSTTCSELPVSPVPYCEIYSPKQDGDAPTAEGLIGYETSTLESDASVSVVKTSVCREIVANEFTVADSDKEHVDSCGEQQNEEMKEETTQSIVDESPKDFQAVMDESAPESDHGLEGGENITSINVDDKSRPTSCTPISGTSWCVVWTGNGKVFFYEASSKYSVWEMPIELKNRPEVQKLIEAPPVMKKQNQCQEEPNNKKIKTSEEITATRDSPVSATEESAVEFETKALQERAATPYEERVEKFRQMLVEKNVSAFSTWEKELHKIVFDPRYLLLTSKERKREFELFIRERVDEEKNEKKRQHRQMREGYRSLLMEAGIDSKTKFSDFAQRYSKDERFKAVEKMKDREKMFVDFVNDIILSEREQIAREKKLDENFIELLKEQEIGERTTWEDIEKVVSNDERFQAIRSNSRKRNLFYDFIKKSSQQKMDPNTTQQERARASIKSREEEVKRDLSALLQEREKEQAQHKHDSAVSCFKALLVDLVRKPDESWKSARSVMRKDHRWESVRHLPTAERERLFEEHISSLNVKKREAFWKLLDSISEIDLTSAWRDIRAVVMHQPACIKFSKDEKKCEREFKEYQRDKFNAARFDFKQLLKETKTITYKSKSLMCNPHYLESIEDVLRNDKRYLTLENFKTERKEILISYIEELHEGGPPPPPTATDPRR